MAFRHNYARSPLARIFVVRSERTLRVRWRKEGVMSVSDEKHSRRLTPLWPHSASTSATTSSRAMASRGIAGAHRGPRALHARSARSPDAWRRAIGRLLRRSDRARATARAYREPWGGAITGFESQPAAIESADPTAQIIEVYSRRWNPSTAELARARRQAMPSRAMSRRADGAIRADHEDPGDRNCVRAIERTTDAAPRHQRLGFKG
jgi:hypothetical protein